jgi:hypothetical protein
MNKEAQKWGISDDDVQTKLYENSFTGSRIMKGRRTYTDITVSQSKGRAHVRGSDEDAGILHFIEKCDVWITDS